MKDKRRTGKTFRATNQSDKLPSRDIRRLAKRALQKREEPQPKYLTGRFWVDWELYLKRFDEPEPEETRGL